MKCFVVVLSCLALACGFPGVRLPEALQEEWARLLERSDLSGCGVSKAGTYDDGDKIVGGRDAKQGELPWQISLQQKSWTGSFSHICGGTVLNRNYIITAAHCVSGGSAGNYQVVVGAHNIKSPNQYHKAHAVASIKVHEQYNSRNIFNDIAILKLSSPIDIAGSNGYVNGACLPAEKEESTGTVSVSGWGATREGGSAPAVLQVVDVPVVSDATCRQQYGASAIADHMLCAGISAGGKDSCQGDSGGPLIQRVGGRAQLVGVVSWGYGCARPGYSGVYTQVSHFIPWILKNTP